MTDAEKHCSSRKDGLWPKETLHAHAMVTNTGGIEKGQANDIRRDLFGFPACAKAVAPVVEQLSQWTLCIRSPRLFPVDGVQSLVYEEADCAGECRPLRCLRCMEECNFWRLRSFLAIFLPVPWLSDIAT